MTLLTWYFCRMLRITMVSASLLILATTVIAQVDLSFNPQDRGYDIGLGVGYNGEILSSAVDANGNVLITGIFSEYDTTSVGNIARLLPSGELDTSFNTGIGVYSTDIGSKVVIQSDGKILLGGRFNHFNGVQINNLVRLETDGSVDPSFNVGTGFDSYVSDIVIQPNGKILVCGLFTTYDGAPCGRIVRLESNGLLDTTFDSSVGANSHIKAFALQPNGKVVMCGGFETYNGAAAYRLARLNADGSLDNTFQSPTDAYSLYDLAVQSDGKIIVTGHFSQINGQSRGSVVRFLSNGEIDNSFTTGSGATSHGNIAGVEVVTLQPDGKILIGGNFTGYEGTVQYGIVRLNTNGTRDTSFDPGRGTGLYNSGGVVYAIELLSNEQLYMSGSIGAFSLHRKTGIFRIDPDGTMDPAFNHGTAANFDIRDLCLQSDGKVLAVGDFSMYDGVSTKYITRLEQNGAKDQTFDIGKGPEELPGSLWPSRVWALAQRPDGKILAGGTFQQFDGLTRRGLVCLETDGSVDQTFVNTGPVNTVIYDIVVQPDGKALITGDFSSYGGLPYEGFVRVDSTGEPEPFNVNTTTDYGPTTIALQQDGKILLAGGFTEYDGNGALYVARIHADGSYDSLFTSPFHQDQDFVNIRSIALQTDGKILLGGDIGMVDTTATNNLIRLNTDGTLDTTFNIGSGFDNMIDRMYLQADGRLVVAGYFNEFNGASYPNVVRLEPNGEIDSTLYIGNMDGFVYAVAGDQYGNVIVGGDFTHIEGVGRNRIARFGTGIPTETYNEERTIMPPLQVHPNPSSGMFNVLSTFPVLEYHVIDVLGKRTMNWSHKTESLRSTMDLSSLAPGQYLIIAQGEERSGYAKVIVE